jgi:Flp pilus assembly pilin Flp
LGGERGQDLVEYALLAGALAFVLLGVSVIGLTEGVTSMLAGIGDCVDFEASTDCW